MVYARKLPEGHDDLPQGGTAPHTKNPGDQECGERGVKKSTAAVLVWEKCNTNEVCWVLCVVCSVCRDC